MGVYVGQVIHGVLDQLHLTVGPLSIQTHPKVISSVPECIIGIDMLSNWQNPKTGSLIFGVRDIKVRRAKWKPLELPLPKKTVNQKQCRTPGGISETSDAI